MLMTMSVVHRVKTSHKDDSDGTALFGVWNSNMRLFGRRVNISRDLGFAEVVLGPSERPESLTQ